MNSKRQATMWLPVLTTLAVAGLLVVGGCALDKNENHPANVFARIGGHSGQVIEPKRCVLKVAIVTRPFGDPTINEVIWRVSDEQIIPPAERRAWEANGLRVGRIVGNMPLEIEAILKDTSPQKKVTPTNFVVDSGEATLLSISAAVDQASLLINRDNRIFGSDYHEASGFFRVTPEQEGTNNVSLRLVPEIHHGPIQRTFQAMPNAAPVGPQEFMINHGQQEETIRELATTIVLEPGQIAIIGGRPEHKRSLGAFLLTQSVAHSDQRLEKLVMIWASRNLQGQAANDDNASAPDRPTLFKRLIGSGTAPASARLDPPTPEIPEMDTTLPTPALSTATAAAGATSTIPPATTTTTTTPTVPPTAGAAAPNAKTATRSGPSP